MTFDRRSAFYLATFNRLPPNCHSRAALYGLGSVSLHNGTAAITARRAFTPCRPVTNLSTACRRCSVIQTTLTAARLRTQDMVV